MRLHRYPLATSMRRGRSIFKEPSMPFATRHRDDPFVELSPLAALEVHHVWDAAFMAGLQVRADAEINDRFEAGHRAYVAWWHEQPAAWGWVATRTASIGELSTTFSLSPTER